MTEEKTKKTLCVTEGIPVTYACTRQSVCDWGNPSDICMHQAISVWLGESQWYMHAPGNLCATGGIPVIYACTRQSVWLRESQWYMHAPGNLCVTEGITVIYACTRQSLWLGESQWYMHAPGNLCVTGVTEAITVTYACTRETLCVTEERIMKAVALTVIDAVYQMSMTSRICSRSILWQCLITMVITDHGNIWPLSHAQPCQH